MIVLDDPVSSLDHRRRQAIARRLVEESKKRPVLIFTHDLVFLLALQHLTEAARLPLAGAHLKREPAVVGVAGNDFPWAGLPTKKRVGLLRTEAQRLEALHKSGPLEKYEEDTKRLYGFLREAWERAVEEVLLNGSVQRFDLGIQTKRLANLSDIQAQDIADVDAGMTKTSQFIRGHDAAPALNPTIPEPAEVKADVELLAGFVGRIKSRRN